jgi:hypothetical protein
MYCPSCGSAVPLNLSYCNHCGAELNGTESVRPREPGLPPGLLVAGISAVTIGGLFATAALVVVTRDVPNFPAAWVMAIVGLTFLLILAADSLFAFLLLRSKKRDKEPETKEFTTQGLRERTVPALSEPGFSVTEHTTRTLEAVDASRESE